MDLSFQDSPSRFLFTTGGKPGEYQNKKFAGIFLVLPLHHLSLF
jgi:hypothetical protein